MRDFKIMTPAVLLMRQSNHPFKLHEYEHDPAVNAYGLEAVQALKVAAERVFKTLLVMLDSDPKQMAVAVIPVAYQLDVKALARALGAKKAELAAARQAERVTGYLVGGISPLGQKKRLPMALDESALDFETIYISAGRRGLEIELAPDCLIKICSADAVSLCR